MNFLEQDLLEDYNDNLDYSGINGKRLASRLSEIAQIGLTSEKGSYRLGYSNEEKLAKELIEKWMNEAGLDTKKDGAGNIIGKKDGKNKTLPSIISGSHVDSVPNGGHFDGVLGILTSLEVVEAWKETNFLPNRSFEIIIFSEEEGSRFNTGFIGSNAMMGDLDLNLLKSLEDQEGQSFEEVIKEVGLTIESFSKAPRDLRGVASYVEVHIEQGKQLEKANQPVGIVTGIAGIHSFELSFKGEAGHAGNTPMNDRKDALVAASEFILKANSLPQKKESSAVVTVGKLHVFPNGTNVIPKEVKLSVDIRDINQRILNDLSSSIIDQAKKISAKHRIEVSWKKNTSTNPINVDKDMQKLQSESIQDNQLQPVYIPSGAGHDAMIVGRHLPIAMFFVRSKEGLSHNPKEWTNLDDCIITVHVLKSYLEKLSTSIGTK